ncbi:DciA family protein [Desulfurella sp.]|uniref:DciA family protein n=1 Tax=Desulfurella sp. TaxID=1962857 RepID=UPI0025C2BED1|nr:DciA family protein [Desulfurella sp.]
MALVDISTATFDLLKDLGLERAVYIVKAKDIFRQLDIDERNVCVLNYKDGILTLGVYNSIWHQEVESIKETILKKLNDLSSDLKFDRIVVKEINYDSDT